MRCVRAARRSLGPAVDDANPAGLDPAKLCDTLVQRVSRTSGTTPSSCPRAIMDLRPIREASRVSASPPAGQARKASSQTCLLALLFFVGSLSGCVDGQAVIRAGVFVAPFSLLLLSLALYEQSGRLRMFVANPYRRPWVLALPTIILFCTNLPLFINIVSVEKNTKQLLDFVINGFFLLSFTMFLGSYVLTQIIWRIWLAFSPRTSYEGANFLGPVLFFGPGVLYAHGFYTKELVHILEYLTIYTVYSFFALPVVVFIIVIEARYRQRAQQSLQSQ
jgi:hypothetical protein